MLNKLNIGRRTRYKVHMIILCKKCTCFTMCAVIFLPKSIDKDDMFYNFCNEQFTCTHKFSDEDHYMKDDLFIFKMYFKILKNDPVEIEVYYTCMYTLLAINYKLDGI